MKILSALIIVFTLSLGSISDANAQVKDNNIPNINDLFSMDFNELFNQLQQELDNSKEDLGQFINPEMMDSMMSILDTMDLNKTFQSLNLNSLLNSDMFGSFLQDFPLDSVLNGLGGEDGEGIIDQLLNGDLLQQFFPTPENSEEEEEDNTKHKI